MPPFRVNKPWVPGVCTWKASNNCAEQAKDNQTICSACWAVADEQMQEDNKQLWPGYYCDAFACWNPDRKNYDVCNGCHNKGLQPKTHPPPVWMDVENVDPPPPPQHPPGDAALPQAPPPPPPASLPPGDAALPQARDLTIKWDRFHIAVDNADPDDLWRIINIASLRLRKLAQHSSTSSSSAQ